MKNKENFGFKHLIYIAIALAVSFGTSFADWSAPDTMPPGNNTKAPINISDLKQVKIGPLAVTNEIEAFSFCIRDSITLTKDCFPKAGQKGWGGIGGGGVIKTIKGINNGINGIFVTQPDTNGEVAISLLSGMPGTAPGTGGTGGGGTGNVNVSTSTGTGAPNGVPNFLTKFINPNTIGNSIIYEDPASGKITIGSASAVAQRVEVLGGPIKATGGLIIETRTSDPVSPEPGRIWLRMDINP